LSGYTGRNRWQLDSKTAKVHNTTNAMKLNEHKLVNLKLKSNLCYTRLIPFRVSRVNGAHLCGFAPGLALQGCEWLSTCGWFDRLRIWTPYQKQTSNDLCSICPVNCDRNYRLL